MFTAENKESAAEMARISEDIQPDEVQINTLMRPCPVKPLPQGELESIGTHFKGSYATIISVYEKMKPEAAVIDKIEAIKRKVWEIKG